MAACIIAGGSERVQRGRSGQRNAEWSNACLLGASIAAPQKPPNGAGVRNERCVTRSNK